MVVEAGAAALTEAGVTATLGAEPLPCAAYATPANAAMPAASPATGRITLRCNSWRCRRSASTGVQPSTSTMRRSIASWSRPSALGEGDDVDSAQRERIAGRGVAQALDDAHVGGEHVVGIRSDRRLARADDERLAGDTRRHPQRDVRGQVVAVTLGELCAHVGGYHLLAALVGAQLRGRRPGRGGRVLAFQAAALAGRGSSAPSRSGGMASSSRRATTSLIAHPSSHVAGPGF